MANVSLKLLVLKTAQVDRLRAFYQVLGVSMAEEQQGSGPVHFAGQVGNAILEIYALPGQGDTAGDTTRLGFEMGSLSEVISAIQGTGGKITSEPRQTTWGLQAVVRDPDGRSVELYQA